MREVTVRQFSQEVKVLANFRFEIMSKKVEKNNDGEGSIKVFNGDMGPSAAARIYCI